MTLILDCAETLFAEKGFNGVTMREVADIAEVDTALMRYYFGDKEKLFRAVFMRRAPEINALRLKAMDEYRRSAGENFTLEGIIDAFVRPAFEKIYADDGWRNYAAIVAYVNNSRGYLHIQMSEAFDHVSRVLIADIKRLLPDAEEREIYWGYHLLTGAFTFSLGQTGRINDLSGGMCDSGDALEIADRFPIAMAAAIRGLCGGASRASRPV